MLLDPSDSLCFTFVDDSDDDGKAAAMAKIRRHFWSWEIRSESHHVIDLFFPQFSQLYCPVIS